jgi:hypothetical protein
MLFTPVQADILPLWHRPFHALLIAVLRNFELRVCIKRCGFNA